MDQDFVIKLVMAFFGAVGAGKVIYDALNGKRVALRSEYEFSKKFIDDVEKNPEMHPLLKELGHKALAGNKDVKGEEIAYLLTLLEPLQAIQNFASGRRYLTHLPKAGNLQLTFKGNYTNIWIRRLRKTLSLLLYFVLAFIALTPFIYATVFLKAKGTGIVFGILVTFVFGYLAIRAINTTVQLNSAEALVNNQEKHQQRIVLDNLAKPSELRKLIETDKPREKKRVSEDETA